MMSAPLGYESQDQPDKTTKSVAPSPAVSHIASASHLDEMVLHDLLNPMTGVLGQLELIEDQIGAELTEKSRQHLEECLASARDLSEMLTDLRSLTQIESGQVSQRSTPVTVKELLHFLQYERAIGDDGAVRIQVEAKHATMYLSEQAGLLRRALSVVLRAAIRLSASPPVTIAAAPLEHSRNNHVRITFHYIGRTLPRLLQDKLLSSEIGSLQRQHGYRIDRARGFELVHHILQLFQGELAYEAADDGGAFVLIFPESTPQEAST